MKKIIRYAAPTLLLALVIIVLYISSKHKSKSEKIHQEKNIVRSELYPKESYEIKPQVFDVGLIDQKVYKSSNICNDTVLKPIIPVDVDYGWQMPQKCACNRYIEAP